MIIYFVGGRVVKTNRASLLNIDTTSSMFGTLSNVLAMN